jgi:hypothetical protein
MRGHRPQDAYGVLIPNAVLFRACKKESAGPIKAPPFAMKLKSGQAKPNKAIPEIIVE